MQRLSSIQSARGVAAIMVVVFHALLISRKYFGAGSGLPDAFVFGQTGVDLFFVISGFVMVLTTRRAHGEPKAVLRFAMRRLLRIYPLYWLYFAVVLAIFLALPGMVNASQGGRVDLVRSFLLLPSVTLPLVQVAWSLTLELWFYCVFFCLLWLPARLLPAGLAVWAGIVVAANLLSVVPATPVVNVVLHASAIQFILGSAACLVFLSKAKVSATGLLLASLILLVLAMSLSPVGTADVIASMSLLRACLFGAFFSTSLLWAVCRERGGAVMFPAFAVRLGDWSYSIYLGHVLVLSACGRMLALLAGTMTPSLASWVFLAVGLPLTICVGFASFICAERPILALSRAVSGDTSRRKPHWAA